MGKSTIPMAIFNSFLYVHQRVSQVAPGLQGDVADAPGAPRFPRLPSLGPRVREFDLAALAAASGAGARR